MMKTSEQIQKFLSNIIGYFCIFVFLSATGYIVYIFYSAIAPALLQQHQYGKFLFHFIFGNWVAINIYFNYIMTWLTSPGLSKYYQNLSIQYPICKKCSINKPPRTHHCSWCNACILRYDHHCPWMNNCIGFYNHRYFYQFCCFMSIGCLYAGSFGYREYQISMFHIQLFQHVDSFFLAADIIQTMGVAGFITYYLFIIALGMGFVLLGLCWWHGRMIGRGETSIERLLNQNYIQQYYKQGFIFVQIHNINPVENWKQFLGVYNMKQFIRRILFPSTHKPKGNGITMDDNEINTNLILYPWDFSESRQDIAYTPSGYHSVPGGYLVSKYRPDCTSWKRESISNSFNSYCRTQTPLIDSRNISYLNQV